MIHNILSNLNSNPVIWVRGMERINSSASTDENSIIINYQVDDRSFKPYYTISEIIRMLEITGSDKNNSMEEVNLAFDNLMSSWKRMDMSSESIIYSIIRRISRESSATSKLIDQLSEKIVGLVNEIFKCDGKNLIIVLNSTEWIDRPSLRVLHRVFKLLPSTQLKLVLGFSGNIPSEFKLNDPFDMLQSIFVARSRIFNRLLVEQNPLIIGEGKKVCDFSNHNFVGTENGLMSDAAIALITQNYENALLACEKVLRTQKGQTEEIFRIIGLVQANLSLYDTAYTAFQKAIKYESNGPKRAHLECLAALLAVKRFYNLDVARTHYESALKFVDESDRTNRLEKGWILNGMSFMDTVAASKLIGKEKEKLLDDVLKRELKALDLIKSEKDSSSLYLKYNLLSNITFLLEIREDYKNALEFWKTAFTKLIGEDHGYCYRTGMLSWKAGKIEEGINYLQEAYQTASLQKDRLDSEKILFAMGFINLEIGNQAEAIKSFEKGIDISLTLRDKENLEEHVKGYIQASSIQGELEHNLIILRKTLESFKDILPNDISELLNKSIPLEEQPILKKKLKQPKTKLSSYHPSVDLEAIPEIDMNEYLIRNHKEQDPKLMEKILTRS